MKTLIIIFTGLILTSCLNQPMNTGNTPLPQPTASAIKEATPTPTATYTSNPCPQIAGYYCDETGVHFSPPPNQIIEQTIIAGTVTDENNKPVANVKITAIPADDTKPWPAKEILTDINGAFVIRELPVGYQYIVTAEQAGWKESKNLTLKSVLTGNLKANNTNFIALPYSFPQLKGTFKLTPFSFNAGYHTSIFLDETGNGLIATDTLLVKVKYFKIAEEVTKYSLGTYSASSSISLDNNGNGIIAWGEGAYGCAGECNLYGHVWSRKIENYSPTGDLVVIDQGKEIYNLSPLLKLNTEGDGNLYYSPSIDNMFYKEVKKFQIEFQERKIYTGDMALLREQFLSKKVNSSGTGGMVYYQGAPVPNFENIYYKKIVNNLLSNDAMILSVNNTTVKGTPVIALNQMGDGLAVWNDGGYIYGRYISNFNPQ